ncbi:MAG: alpha/beta hydrolase [Erythrobacter sp.]|uniref:alpha/beta fold hydrolase n=1 Tax=Erythrobacter sp. TaxID=1042 RepID=UPI00262F7035|nr:alpha/beta hydrolase [Erythrobacter sp.]MDJ0978344.1 alpha/beta hydrolase [Erythrobacter sp.]
MSDVLFHTMPDGRKIAHRFVAGEGPTLVFLPGYMSDMDGGKATAVFAAAQEVGRACLLLDYSGCGRSSGAFAQGTLSRWREEVLALIEACVQGPVLLVGSSMGGWLMLLVAEELRGSDSHPLAGIIGIAPAPDFTTWGYSEEQRATLAAGETVYEDNPYGPEPTPTYPGFFADAQDQLMLAAPIALDCPVRLLHGRQDADVPWEISVALAEALDTDDVQVTLLWDGDHRLSREGDIALLKRVVSEFYEN